MQQSRLLLSLSFASLLFWPDLSEAIDLLWGEAIGGKGLKYDDTSLLGFLAYYETSPN